MTKQDTIKQGKSPHTEAREGNPTGGKGSQKQTKESKTNPLPLLEVPQKNKADRHRINTKNLVQKHVSPILGDLVSKSPSESLLIDSVGHVLLVFSMPSDFYNLFSFFCCVAFVVARLVYTAVFNALNYLSTPKISIFFTSMMMNILHGLRENPSFDSY